MKQLRNFRSNSNNDTRSSNTFVPSENPLYSDAMKKYGGMQEDELINQLLASVRTQRANGTYNPQQMNAYVQMLKPHLSQTQVQKLENVINIINSENV